MTLECEAGHVQAKVVYRRPATTPREIKLLRWTMIIGVLLTIGNLIALTISLSDVATVSAEMLGLVEEARAGDGGEEFVVLADIVRAFDNLIVFLTLGAFAGVFIVLYRYAMLLWKGFTAGSPAAYSAIAAIAKLQLAVLVFTLVGPALVFAGNEVVSFSPAFGIGMAIPFVLMFFLRKPAVKAYFSVHEVVRGPDLPDAAAAPQGEADAATLAPRV